MYNGLNVMDIITLAVGFIIGVIVVAIAIEFGSKKDKVDMPNSRRTTEWNINEINNPKIMAEYLGNVTIPDKSMILVNKYKDSGLFKGLNTRRNTEIKGNYILGDDRALILSGPMKEGELGFWTVEKEIVNSLHEDFDFHWNNGQMLKTDEKK